MADRVVTNYDHPNSLETELMTQHVRELKMGRSIQVPEYDFGVHTRKGGLDWLKKDATVVRPAAVVLVEGILLFENAALRDEIDLRIYVDTDADLRFIRRMTRDIMPVEKGGRGRQVEDVVAQYTTTVRPMHNIYVEPSKAYAHIILPQDNRNTNGDGAIVRAILALKHTASGV
eukprot:SAG22_NODE_55_length_23749_cov_24.622918_11_plen_174_part_00